MKILEIRRKISAIKEGLSIFGYNQEAVDRIKELKKMKATVYSKPKFRKPKTYQERLEEKGIEYEREI